ncbi:MAG: GNAT family N-acetyltransferase [Chloroflexi bacterium]|nr:MAG: GNAT family N-acetyltransferase [Chloroflexota bacterium]
MPRLRTERLLIRPFVMEDLESVHRVLSNAWGVSSHKQEDNLPARERWLRWTVANYGELAALTQPPYGDRAVVLMEDGRLIGSVGLVPAMGPFGQLAGFPVNQGSHYRFPEVGLYWALDPEAQTRGFATEAARALIEFAFGELNLGRIVATTEYTNAASIAVMRKLKMRVLRNPEPTPAWFQIVGLLEREPDR